MTRGTALVFVGLYAALSPGISPLPVLFWVRLEMSCHHKPLPRMKIVSGRLNHQNCER
jgi:hypothetical protein